MLNVSCGINELVKVPLHVKNTSLSTINVKAKKIYGSILLNSENTFCFAGNCYPENTMTSVFSSTLDFNEIDTTFEADYNANGSSGNSTITYVFFNTANTSDSVCVVVNYTSSVGINELADNDMLKIDVYPNPANDVVKINYNLNEPKTVNINIYNNIGILVFSSYKGKLQSGKHNCEINVSDFTKGIYFVNMQIGDTHVNKKIIIE